MSELFPFAKTNLNKNDIKVRVPQEIKKVRSRSKIEIKPNNLEYDVEENKKFEVRTEGKTYFINIFKPSNDCVYIVKNRSEASHFGDIIICGLVWQTSVSIPKLY